MRAKLFTALIALLAILFVAAPPAVANTAKSGREPIPVVLTVNITASGGDLTITWVTVPQDMATWTSFQRGDGLTIAAIPALASAPTATVRDLATDEAILSNLPRLADCTGTAHGDIDTTAKPAPTALISSAGGFGQPLRR